LTAAREQGARCNLIIACMVSALRRQELYLGMFTEQEKQTDDVKRKSREPKGKAEIAMRLFVAD